MNMNNLSSNWKKLQESGQLKKNAKQERSKLINVSRNGEEAKRHELTGKKRKLESDFDSNSQKRVRSGDIKASKQGAKAMSLSLKNEGPSRNSQSTTQPGISRQAEYGGENHPQAGKYIALDCEMVATLTPPPNTLLIPESTVSGEQEYSILARVSIVNIAGEPVYDAYVLPPPGCSVSDYRTKWSGIKPGDLSPTNPNTKPKPPATVHEEVSSLLKGRVLVGHALKNDFQALGLEHPARDTRDTSRHTKFRELTRTKYPGLARLAYEVLGWEIQKNGHDSLEDARATMALFVKEKEGFEMENLRVFGRLNEKQRVKAKDVFVDSGQTNGQPGEKGKKKNKKKKKKKKQ